MSGEPPKQHPPVSSSPEAPGRDADRDPFASLRHALLNRLNQIIGYSELLQEEAADAGLDRFAGDLKKIEQAARQQLQLVRTHLSSQRGTPSPGTSSAAAVSADGEQAPARTSRGTAELARIAEVRGRLLVVDDSVENLELLARHLALRGHEVHTADGGARALQAIEEDGFDLVLLDVMMPQIGGLDVLVALRERLTMADLPVIMTTARDASQDIVEALQLGANDYVTKPLDIGVVLARVQTQLALKRARDQVRKLNHQLEQARARIARLAASSSKALHDIGAWCSSVLQEVTAAIGAEELAVWSFQEGRVSSVAGRLLRSPTRDELNEVDRRGRLVRQSDVVLQVKGFSGKMVGALVVSPLSAMQSEEARQLVDSFRVQLGGVLEMDRMRRELAEAAERRRVSREEMLARGIDVLRVCPLCGLCYDQRSERCSVDGVDLDDSPVYPYRVNARYRLTRLLGKGGMGTVYRARDEQLDRDVAVKILQPRFFNDQTMRTRFENEARALGRIAHPGVIGVHDFGELEDGSMYIVMELLIGCDLKAMTRAHGPGRPNQVANLLRQGAAALAAAHEARLVHRDIKPENVFVTPAADGGLHFKLLDFGIAKEVAIDSGLTRTGDLLGTPMYMAPEQMTGGAPDPRSDLYSFAAVAYEALVGRRVVEGKDLPTLLIETFRNQPALISSTLPDASPAVDMAFASALARHPDDRPACVTSWVESFVDELERAPSPFAGWPDDFSQLLEEAESPTLTGDGDADKRAPTASTAAIRPQK